MFSFYTLNFANEKPSGEKGRPSGRKATNSNNNFIIMELICRIIEQGALTTRQYTDRQGQPQTFVSMPFVLASGADTFFCEMTGEDATKCGSFDPKYYYKASLSARVTSFQSQQGDTVKKTSLYLNRISVL